MVSTIAKLCCGSPSLCDYVMVALARPGEGMVMMANAGDICCKRH